MTIEEEAIWLSQAVILLDKYRFIQACEPDEEGHCAHLHEMALHHAENIRNMFRAAAATQRASDEKRATPYVDESACLGLDISNKNNGP